VVVSDYIILGVALGLFLGWVYFKKIKSGKEQQLRKRGLSKKWQKYLDYNVDVYHRLPRQYRNDLHGYINLFLNDKQFIACAGLEMTDEIRLTIAAQACILLLHSDNKVYPEFHTIMVYPSAYYAEEEVRDGLVVSQEKSLRVGESWERGIVVLSWDEVLNDARGESPGHNVVIHEFAHRLDQQNVNSEGVPLLDSSALYQQWASVLSTEYETLKEDLAQGHETVIDSYGATSPAEFFAVVSEMYFELPKVLQANHSELYSQLDEFYQLGPANW